MNSRNNILKEINDGKNLEVALPEFGQTLMNYYYESGLIRLAMNYFTFYEVVKDKGNPQIKNVKKLTKLIHSILKEGYLSEFDGKKSESLISKLDGCRTEITNKMQILTTYTDMLQVYEYVLNRLEYKYTKTVPKVENEKAVQEIIGFIFETKDNIVIHNRIQEVIGQLPIRFAKTKYFELLSNSLSVYKGSDKESVENYIYILKTSGMLYKPDGMVESFSNLSRLIEELKTADYKNLDHKTYVSLCKKLKKSADFINDMADVYVELEEIVNHLYVVLLTLPYVSDTDGIIEDSCKYILSKLNQNFLENSFDEDSLLIEKLQNLEGKQEEIGISIDKYESVLYDIKEKYGTFIDDIMQKKVFQSLYLCEKLLSTSLFIDIYKKSNNEVADEEFIINVTQELILEWKELFKENTPLVNRAIMANTIQRMPVFFKNANEVAEYIMNSLTNCNDIPEKAMSINMIQQLMEC